MQPNHVKEVLKAGGCAVGTMIHRFVYADVGALVKRAGVDFVLIDTEHAPLGMESVSLLCIATRAAGVVPIVRVPDSQYHLIARRLDAGALGIMMPRVKTRAEVELIVESAKYPPLGGRGCGIRPVMLDFESTGSLSGDMDWINENIIARGARAIGTGLWKGGDAAVIDGFLVNGSWKVVGWVSGAVRWLQTGYLYHYAFAMILGVFVLMTYFVWLNK